VMVWRVVMLLSLVMGMGAGLEREVVVLGPDADRDA
jgi:hypothetical protein